MAQLLIGRGPLMLPDREQPASVLQGKRAMPYDRISELPKEQTDQYSTHQKHAFLEAFNNALEQYKDESRAFAVAHSAAQRAPREEPKDDD
jgi:cation transport regulator